METTIGREQILSRAETLRITVPAEPGGPALAAGSRAYLVGDRDGGFADRGWHVPGEMGGLWTHPIKLFDGFWLQIAGEWLERAQSYTSGAFWSEHEYVLSSSLVIRRLQFVPPDIPAVIVRWYLRSPEPRGVDLRLLARSDLRPVWPDMRPVGGQDEAQYLPAEGTWLIGTPHAPWAAVAGAVGRRPIDFSAGRELWGPQRTAGDGVSVALTYRIDLPAGVDIPFDVILAGSDQGGAAAVAAFHEAGDIEERWQDARRRSDDLLARSDLTVPEHSLQRTWDWLKINFDWLVRDVPGTGRGLGAGLDDYPWWFGCDNAYALLGCLALGQHEIAVETVDLLRRVSEGQNGPGGRVIHECSTSGTVADPGRTQETSHLAIAVAEIARWTGDREFLDRVYPFCRAGVLGWVVGEQCAPGDILPAGYGLIEIEGLDLHCVDSAAQTVEALAALRWMAEVVGDWSVAETCAELHARLQMAVEEEFWLPGEGIYGDMLATPAEMARRLRRWIEHPSAQSDAEAARLIAHYTALLAECERDAEPNRSRPWFLGNWSVAMPLLTGVASPGHAAEAFNRLESPEFTGPWGLYLNGIAQGPAMSISTGGLSMAEMRYGRIEQGLRYIRLLTDTLDLQLPGAIAEMSPDWGCFVQAWSGYAIAWPVVTYLFGIQPDAMRRRVELRPQFPPGWEGARLANVRIGGTIFDFAWDRSHLHVHGNDGSWTIEHGVYPAGTDRTGGGR